METKDYLNWEQKKIIINKVFSKNKRINLNELKGLTYDQIIDLQSDEIDMGIDFVRYEKENIPVDLMIDYVIIVGDNLTEIKKYIKKKITPEQVKIINSVY